MFPLLALWFLFTSSGRARARRAEDAYRGELVNPWTGERVLSSQGGGLADPWGDSAAPRAPARQTQAASQATTASRKLSWMLGASDAQAAQSKAAGQLNSAIAALLATGPLTYTQAPLMIQSAGPGKWYAMLDVDNDAARGRLRAELGRTPGVYLPT